MTGESTRRISLSHGGCWLTGLNNQMVSGHLGVIGVHEVVRFYFRYASRVEIGLVRVVDA